MGWEWTAGDRRSGPVPTGECLTTPTRPPRPAPQGAATGAERWCARSPEHASGHEPAAVRVTLGDLVSDTGQRPLYVFLAEDDPLKACVHRFPSWPHGTRLKEREECIRAR